MKLYLFFLSVTLISFTLYISTMGLVFFNDPVSVAAYEYLNRHKLIAKPFDQKKLASFKADKVKVVLVGDSYAKDIFNAISLTSLREKYDISTWSIGKECGNLSVQRTKFQHHVPKKRLLRCQMTDYYENPTLKLRLSEADQIWLASSWYLWVARLLPESVKNLEKLYGKPVLVFGPKSFGNQSIADLIRALEDPNLQRLAVPHPDVVLINDKLAETLPSSIYIDILDFFCVEEDSRCNLFVDGKLISHDGAHLTTHGAVTFGNWLAKVRF